MSLDLRISAKLSQGLILTPQLQQALKLLQLGRADFIDVIYSEAEQNPLLVVEGEKLPRYDSKSFSSLRSIPTVGPNYIDSISDKSGRGLAEHLVWQIRTSHLVDHIKRIAIEIIGNLDQNGYLTTPSQQIISGINEDTFELVLKEIQKLDPPGVGARNLRECLLSQLVQLGQEESIAYKIVDHHMGDLSNKRYLNIARLLHVSEDDVKDGVRMILRLEPRPGRNFSDTETAFVVPDVVIKRIGYEFVVMLNEEGLPKLKLDSSYEDLLSRCITTDDTSFVKEKYRTASWMLKMIAQRQKTIYRVAVAILQRQREFLEQGPSALRPMILKDIAADLGMHESTVSRTTNDKFIATPHGTFELKYFFTSSLKNSDNEDISSECIRERIKEILNKENLKSPMSDEDISGILKTGGFKVARRTVAKYRDILGILSSSKRKQSL